MSRLTHSKSEQLLLKLRKDYEILKEEYPLRSLRAGKKEIRKEIKL
jgi:hypothetical protein